MFRYYQFREANDPVEKAQTNRIHTVKCLLLLMIHCRGVVRLMLQVDKLWLSKGYTGVQLPSTEAYSVRVKYHFF